MTGRAAPESGDAVVADLGELDWELESDAPVEAEGLAWEDGHDADFVEAPVGDVSADIDANEPGTDHDDPTHGAHYDAWEAEYQAALATLEAGE